MERSIFHVVVMLSLLLHGVRGDVCEKTWIMYGEDMCFKYFDDGIVQAETKKHCSSVGARQLTALTTKLKDFLILHMDEGGNSSYWCDALANKIDSSPLPRTSTLPPHLISTSPKTSTLPSHLTSTSPKTVSSTTKKDETCYYLKDKALHEGNCNIPRGYICEKDSIVPPATCPEGTKKIGTNCFWTTSNTMNKTEAAAACASQDGWLANVDTRRKQIYAISTVALKRKNLWIGGTRQGAKIKWGNGKILDPEQGKEFVPVKNEGGDCVILGINEAAESGTSWIFQDCSRTAYGLCEKAGILTHITMSSTTSTPLTTPAPSCPGYVTNDREKDGICYWETTHETPRFDWDGARKYCQSYGGDLASYKNAAEEELSLGGAKGHGGGLWMGLRRDPDSHAFRWSDGTSLTYTNWAPGQPKLRGNLKLCVAHTGPNSTWEALYCGGHRWFVCKIPKATIPQSPLKPTEPPIPECRREKSSPLITWRYYDGYCYVLYQTRGLSWDTAKSFCKDNGAFLASLHSLDEIDFLLQLSPDYKPEKNFWLGLRTKGLHSSYRWDDGTPLDFVNWEDDDPYDDKSNIDTCVTFDRLTGSWKKLHCNQLEYVMCKAQNGTYHTFSTPAPTPSLPGYCPDEWYTFGNKCYKLFGARHKTTWSEASRKCTQIGAELVSIHSRKENDFLELLVLIPLSDTWIGMYSTIGGRLFHWTDNSSMDYTNWDIFEPSFQNKEEECVHLVFNVREDTLGKWNDHRCSMRFPFICQIPKDPMLTKPGKDPFFCANPKGWIKLGSSCYQIFNDSDNRLTWLQAQSYCLSLRSNLASIKNIGVSTHLRNNLMRSTELFWIGMRDTTAHTYRWIGSSPLVSYTNWLMDQPKQVSPFHNCVAVDADGKWMVRSCDESHPFICEESNEAPTVAPPEPDLVCPNTTKKWIDFGGRFCYDFETKEQVSWYRAAHNCFTLGGYLASIHSQQEMEAILHRIKDSSLPLHIGFGQKEDGSFGWIDGTAVDYVNWAPGEPNAGTEMCVEMHTDIGTWNDVNCESKRGFVCSARKVPRQVSTTDALSDKREDLENRINAGGIAGIIICVLVVLTIAAVAFYYLCPSTRMRVWRQSATSQL